MPHGGFLVITRVVDPHHFHADSDPDTAFHFNADPDLYPDPGPLQSDGHLRPLKAVQGSILNLEAFIVSL